MRISHATLATPIVPPFLVLQPQQEKALKPVPQLSAEERAIFGHIEQTAQQMTIDDLMAKLGISAK